MKFSLPLRIFLVHLLFTVGAAALAVVLVAYSFRSYKDSWESEVQTLSTEVLFQPLANEIARSMLLRMEQGYAEEVREQDNKRISQGLAILLRELPSIRSVVIVDREGRIQYASEPETIDLGFTGAADASFFASSEVVRRRQPVGDGESVTDLMVPIFENPGPHAIAGDRRRLGSLVVRYVPDPALFARVPALEPPSIETETFVLPVALFLAAVAAGGVLIAALTGLPVKRLDTALQDFRARGYRGGLHIRRNGLQPELASAVTAINEMGGRLQAMDDQGREREALLATLAQSLEDGMIVLDSQGVPVAWNPPALRILLSCALPATQGDPSRQDAEREALLAALMRNPELSGAGGAVPETKHELALIRPDGSRVPVEITRVPFEVRPGREGTLVLIRDLAMLGKIEAHLLEAGRFAVLAHLAAGLAHEIRNPLHSIGLNAGVVEQYLNMEPSRRGGTAMSESLNSIQDETRRLTDLLNNYLGLVRPERSTGPVEIRELCRRVHRLLAYSAAQSNVEIRIGGEDEVPPVEGVAGQLQQAILNLVLNSIQAMPRGGVVSLDVGVQEGEVTVTVSDTGPGLPLALEGRMFDVRVTTKPEGTGLGLPLVRLIAEAHGGHVSYRERSGGGAAFELRLPLRVAA